MALITSAWADFTDTIFRGEEWVRDLGPITVKDDQGNVTNLDWSVQLVKLEIKQRQADTAPLKTISTGSGIIAPSPANSAKPGVASVSPADTALLPAGEVFIQISICDDMDGTNPQTYTSGSANVY